MDQGDKRLERALAAWALERAPDPLVVLDAKGGVELANRAAREQLGFDVRAALSASSGDPELAAFLTRLRELGEASAEVQLAGGQRGARWVELRGSVVEGKPVVQLRDVSAARQGQAELVRLRRLESVGHLTASVVHDFNNILTVILCIGALLERDVEGSEHALALAREIRWAAERGSHLVAQVRGLLRGEGRRVEGINVALLLAEVSPLIERVLGPHSRLEVKVEGAGDVFVDRERLVQVLLNLAANARDAMPHGGLLTVQAFDLSSPGQTPGQGDDYVALLLTDTGAGMSRETSERVFDGFFTTKGATGGTGLGLATAYRFITESGGHMSLRSEPGEGTTVAIYLPRDPRKARPSASSPRHALPRGTEAVLLFEQDEWVCSALRQALEGQGYRVLAASSLESAVAMAKRPRPRPALVLAGSHHQELARRLPRGLRLIALSGEVDDPSLVDERGPRVRVLRKGFSAAELAWAVREALDAPDERPTVPPPPPGPKSEPPPTTPEPPSRRPGRRTKR